MLIHPQKLDENNGNCAIQLAVGPKHSQISEFIFETFRGNSRNNEIRATQVFKNRFYRKPRDKYRLYPRRPRILSDQADNVNGSDLEKA